MLACSALAGYSNKCGSKKCRHKSGVLLVPIMKELDVSWCELVSAGQPWTYDKDPCCREMIKLLERNERYCTWFQPSGKGLESQFPAIEIRGKYYQLSLLVQKAIFRHIRLNKQFKNIEHVADGRLKLRIPWRLLCEKKRTSNRFTVCALTLGCKSYLLCLLMQSL